MDCLMRHSFIYPTPDHPGESRDISAGNFFNTTNELIDPTLSPAVSVTYPRFYPQRFDKIPKLCHTLESIRLIRPPPYPISTLSKIVARSSSPLIRTLLTCTILASLALPGCSWPGDPVGVDEQSKNLESDMTLLYGEQEPIAAPLTLYEAMARGVKYNINQRVALMEEVLANSNTDVNALGMLPGLDLEGAYVGRNNAEAISARSKATGLQSLEPSIFQDEHRRIANLDLSWNTLDAGMAYVQSRQASDQARAMTERRRKVVQNIAQDVRAAYWRAASAQILGEHIDGLLTRADNVLRLLEEEESKKSTQDISALLTLQKRLYDTMQDLMAERDALATSKAELAALIGVPPSTDFRLASPEADMMSGYSLPRLTTSRQDLEVLALLIRPEMREQTLIKRVAARGQTASVLETFPGIGGIVGYNYDSNSFLDDESWASFSVGLTANLMKLFTLPVRLQHAENKEKLADLQRMAMVATVLTQMSIADTRYDMAQDRYNLLKRMMGVNTRLIEYTKSRPEKTAMADGLLLAAEMDSLLTRSRLHIAYAEGQNAFGRIVNTLGLDPLPPGVEQQSVPQMAQTMQARFESLDSDVISNLLGKIRERTNLLSPDGVILPILRPQGQIIPASASVAPQVEPAPEMTDNPT